jgi:hypothetical protein
MTPDICAYERHAVRIGVRVRTRSRSPLDWERPTVVTTV